MNDGLVPGTKSLPAAVRLSPPAKVRSADHVHVGDLVVYGAKHGVFEERDEIRVSQIAGRNVLGYREHPQDWESEVEFTIFGRQIEDRGVLVVECVVLGEARV